MTPEAAAAEIDANGYVIVEGVAPPAALAEARAALKAHLPAFGGGRNAFEGFKTRRVYTLPRLSRAFDPFLLDPLVLAVARMLLAGDCLLSTALAAEILPGERAQAFHHDDVFYPLPRPRPPVSVSAVWAVDDFTAENGATELILGSHRWGDDRRPAGPSVAEALAKTRPAAAPLSGQDGADTLVPAEMPAGSLLIFSGTLYHRAGANRSGGPRLGLFPQYCAAWARQQENFALSVPPEAAAAMPEALQALLGYQIHPPFMGHVSGRHPLKLLR